MKATRTEHAMLFANELFQAAINAAKLGKTHTITWEFDDGGSVDFEVRVSKVNGMRMSLAKLKKIFKGAPRP